MQVPRELGGQKEREGLTQTLRENLVNVTQGPGVLEDLREGQQQQDQKGVRELVCLLERLGKGNLMDSR